MDKLRQNEIAFLKEKPRKLFFISLLIMLVLILVIIVSFKIEIYDHYLAKGYVKCDDNCKIIVALPTEINIQKIKYKNKYWQPQVLSKTLNVDEEQVISYYLYTFSNDLGFNDKEIVEFNFCYNKQRIIKKFIEKIF